MDFKNFRSEKGVLHVSCTSGHSAVITKEFSPIPEVLWGMAYTLGAIPEDTVSKTDATKEFIREQTKILQDKADLERDRYKAILEEAYDSPNSYVNIKGDLSYRKISKLFEEAISQETLEPIWLEILSERGSN
jgi:hypothetical protein